jgi:hypothetical protein
MMKPRKIKLAGHVACMGEKSKTRKKEITRKT